MLRIELRVKDSQDVWSHSGSLAPPLSINMCLSSSSMVDTSVRQRS